MTKPKPTPTEPVADLIEPVVAIALAAGEAILGYYGPAADASLRRKADASPVTIADEAAERLILDRLVLLTPDIPTVSEEAHHAGLAPRDVGRRFWLVDPLDGTKEFLKRNDEFTVNIALIEDRRPVLGVVYAPALERLYVGAGPGTAEERRGGARRPIAARLPPAEGLTVVASRSHLDEQMLGRFLAGHKVSQTRNAGSSLKFCLIAAGEADLYPRLGRTMEWDTAAGHAVLAAAGGRVTVLDGADLAYGKPGFENPHFVARGLL